MYCVRLQNIRCITCAKTLCDLPGRLPCVEAEYKMFRDQVLPMKRFVLKL